jgi:H+/Cl- antiporter ClcA
MESPTPIPPSWEGERSRITAFSVVLLLVALGLVVVGFIYFTRTSTHLPTFLPGHYEPNHAPGHVAQAHKHHVKLGLLAFGLALLAVIASWYVSEPEAGE